MKDLLTKGSGNIYFLGHVFRKEEEGSVHSSEFTMLEYYRTKTTEKIFLAETIDYLSLFLGSHPVETITYSEALKKFTPDKLPKEMQSYTKEERRHYIFSHYLEPNLAKNTYIIITNFPQEEASLAKTVLENGEIIAKRYEIFFNGTELANGFFELSCAKTALERFEKANAQRITLNKSLYPIDHIFIKHLKNGLPNNTYGIAIGFDRLLMLAHKLSTIQDIIF